MRRSGVWSGVQGRLIIAAMILLAALDWAYYSAYVTNWVGNPVRGLAAWGRGSGVYDLKDCFSAIVIQNVGALIAMLLAFAIARRILRTRGGAFRALSVTVGFLLLLVLVALSVAFLHHMLVVIMGGRPPNG